MTPYLKKGDQLGGVQILGVVVFSDSAIRHRVYRVRHLCCGSEADMPNEIVSRRAKEDTRYCAHCGRKKGGHARLTKTSSEFIRVKGDSSFRVISELPAEERPKVPSAASIIALWESANRRVKQRNAKT